MMLFNHDASLASLAPRTMMVLTGLLLLLLAYLPVGAAHFSSPAAAGGAITRARVIGVTGRTMSPRRRSFSLHQNRRWNLYASTEASSFGDNDDEAVPEDYEESIVVPEPQSTTKTKKEFRDLGFGGKIVRAVSSLVYVTGFNFCLGAGFGGVTGGVRGFPNLMTRKEGLFGTPWKEEYGMRWTRYSGKCYRWGTTWSQIFAIWGFTDTFMSVIRNGHNDEFNFMVASSVAAVWHNREKSMQRKVIVAVGYAALTYCYVKINEYYLSGPKNSAAAEAAASAEAGDGDDDATESTDELY